MREPLHDHVVFLEDRLQEFSSLLTSRSQTPAQRAQTEERIRLINEALEHYRRGFEIEYYLRNLSAAPTSPMKKGQSGFSAS